MAATMVADLRPTHLISCSAFDIILESSLQPSGARLYSAEGYIRRIVTADLDPEFIACFAIDIAWRYDRLFEALAANPWLTPELRKEQFGKRRGFCAVESLLHAANRFGVPYNFRVLECNGQPKLLVKAGRVVLLQEPMLSLTENPRSSEYKRTLAASHALIRQLELDLGDQPGRIRDWSGCVLGIVLHGAAGDRFTREHKALGGLILGVPNDAYSGWDLRLDLHRLAMFGEGEAGDLSEATPNVEPVQADEVLVTPRRKTRKAENP